MLSQNSNDNGNSDKNTSKDSSGISGYLVNREVVGKLKTRKPYYWTLFTEWDVCILEDAIRAHLDGKDVIWGIASKEALEKSIQEQASGQHLNRKGKPTDSKGRRTVDDAMIEMTDVVLLDVDKVSFNQTPQHIKDNAWIFYPSASQEGEVNGDVAKMHYLFRMPVPIANHFIKRYRQIFLDRMCGSFDYDHAVVSPRWEFYGKNPLFTDERYIKRDDRQVIDVDLHKEILQQIIKERAEETKASCKAEKKDKTSLSYRFDQYLLENKTLEEIVIGLFPNFEWSHKGGSHGVEDQWECRAEMFDPDAQSDTGLAVYHSGKSGKILATHKGGERTMNIVELYARQIIFASGKEQPDKVDLKGHAFFKATSDICQALELEPFKFDADETNWHEILPNYVKCLGDKTEKNVFYYWDLIDKVWDRTLSTNTLIARCLSPLMTELADESHESLLRLMDNLAKKVIPTKPQYSIKKPLEVDRNLIGFKNGTYDIKAKKLLEPSPEQFCFYRMDYNFSLVDLTINDRVEALLKKWAYLHPTDWQLIRDWAYATFLRRGDRWSAGMFFYGDPGSGKSMVCKALRLIDPSAVISIQATDMMNDRYPFSKYHEGVHSLYIDDVRDVNNAGMNKLYELLTEDSYVEHSAKYMNSTTIKRYSTFAFTSEKFPVHLRNDQSGMQRRAVGVELRWGTKKFPEIKQEMMAIFDNATAMRQWFMWTLQNVNEDELLERFQGYTEDKSRTDKLAAEIASEAPMIEFAHEKLEVGQSDDDYVLRSDLIRELQDYARLTNDSYLGKLNTFQLVKKFQADVKTAHPDGALMAQVQSNHRNTQGSARQVRIGEKLETVVWGIKFKAKPTDTKDIF